MRKLYRSREHKMVAGVCGGLGEYFHVDPTIIRLIWIVLFLLPPHFFLELLLYVVMWIVVPKAPKQGKKIA